MNDLAVARGGRAAEFGFLFQYDNGLALKRERPPDRKADDTRPYDDRIDIRHASFPPFTH